MPKSDPVLVAFGPGEGKLPVGHRWCNHCGGEKVLQPCPVCGTKGYWNRDDIRRYHESAPEVCRSSCGEDGHTDPHWMPGEPHVCWCGFETMDYDENLAHKQACLDELEMKTQELLEKHDSSDDRSD